MSKADEMIKNLGYEIYEQNEVETIYIKRNRILDDVIEIDLAHKEIVKKDNEGYSSYFTLQELQAINEKVKELGWLDENS